MADTMIHVLGYANDAVILEDGTPAGQQKLGSRINVISQVSKEDSDMLLNADKTVVMHIRMQDDVSPTTLEEAQDVCKFTCPHLNCGFKFRTKAGMMVHAGKCEWKNEFEVQSIIDHRGPTIASQYRIRWKDYTVRSLTRGIQVANGVYVNGW